MGILSIIISISRNVHIHTRIIDVDIGIVISIYQGIVTSTRISIARHVQIHAHCHPLQTLIQRIPMSKSMPVSIYVSNPISISIAISMPVCTEIGKIWTFLIIILIALLVHPDSTAELILPLIQTNVIRIADGPI